jgi:predicted transcriptional regulator
MKDKELLLEAIDNYDIYTSHQRLMLKCLVTLSIDGVVTVGASYLSEQLNLSRTAIYKNLRKFLEEGLINKIKGFNTYELNPAKLNHIAQLYQNKKSLKDLSKT